MRQRFCLVAALLFLSCRPPIRFTVELTSQPQPASAPASQESPKPPEPPPPPPDPPASVRLEPLDPFVPAPPDAKTIARLFLVGDSQIHYLEGKRSFAQAGWVDKQVEVAIRPVHLDLSSDLLLDEFLRFYKKG